MRYLLSCLLLVGAAPVEHRSLGYAGSTPVGLEGYVAFANFDCTKMNADPLVGRVRTPIPANCRLVLPSPDGSVVVTTEPTSNGTAILHATGGLVVRDLDQPTVLRWSPDSSGFLVNGGEGSGQVSHMRYFYRTAAGWRESQRLAVSAAALYRRRFDCRGGVKSYTNTSGWDWPSAHRLRMIVQEGVHSAGCLQPHENHNVLFEVIGDPVTGRVWSAQEIETLA